MYSNIGMFTEEELKGELKSKLREEILEDNKKIYRLENNERKERIKAFLEIFLTPSYVLPRRTNSLNIPEYIGAIIVLSKKGPLPVFQYLDYDFENECIDMKKIEELVKRGEIKEKIKEQSAQVMLIDYFNAINHLPKNIKKISVSEAVSEISKFL